MKDCLVEEGLEAEVVSLVGRRLLTLAKSIVNADSKGDAIPHSCDTVLQAEEDHDQSKNYNIY